jgi:thioredoxin-related protein
MGSSIMPTACKRSGQYAILVLLACLISCGTAQAVELLMVTSPTCPYCKAWEIEVGSIYDKTAESRVAALRRIDIKRIETTPYRFKEPVQYTPTFILLDKGVEVGRILGYSDEAAFWGLLNELLTKLPPSDNHYNPISLEADPEHR